MIMIDFIIYSRKRPMQLYALLESLPINIIPKIIVKTDPEYSAGYNLVWEKFGGMIGNIIEETNFREDTLNAIGSNLTALCTDDCMFFRKPEDIPNIPPIEDNSTFSFRYGFNTVLQDHTKNFYQPYLNLYTDRGHYIEFLTQNYNYPYNYAYALACDGHIFTNKKLKELCGKIEFNNSNTLEGNLQEFRYEISIIKCHKQSSLVCIPCNNLSGYTKAGFSYPYSVEYLNQKFLNGERIDIDNTFKDIKIIGSHQEIKFKFK